MNEILVLQITKCELKELIFDIFREALNELQEELKREEPIELLTRKETAAFLKISLPTLHQWSKDGRVKFYRKSGRVYYKRNELLESIEVK